MLIFADSRSHTRQHNRLSLLFLASPSPPLFLSLFLFPSSSSSWLLALLALFAAGSDSPRVSFPGSRSIHPTGFVFLSFSFFFFSLSLSLIQVLNFGFKGVFLSLFILVLLFSFLFLFFLKPGSNAVLFPARFKFDRGSRVRIFREILLLPSFRYTFRLLAFSPLTWKRLIRDPREIFGAAAVRAYGEITGGLTTARLREALRNDNQIETSGSIPSFFPLPPPRKGELSLFSFSLREGKYSFIEEKYAPLLPDTYHPPLGYVRGIT